MCLNVLYKLRNRLLESVRIGHPCRHTTLKFIFVLKSGAFDPFHFSEYKVEFEDDKHMAKRRFTNDCSLFNEQP